MTNTLFNKKQSFVNDSKTETQQILTFHIIFRLIRRLNHIDGAVSIVGCVFVYDFPGAVIHGQLLSFQCNMHSPEMVKCFQK